jgi:hypothetical protein
MSFTTLINYSTKTANYTLVNSDDVVQFNCASGSLVATLPDATLATVGKRFKVRRAADATIANTLTVNTTSSQTIDTRASGSIHLAPSDYLEVVSDGSNWQVVTLQETISIAYGLTTSQAVSGNAVIKYDTKLKDTHGAFSTSTGLFTAPAAGLYTILCQGAQNTATDLYIKVTGVAKSYIVGMSAANFVFASAITWPLNAGDTIGIYTDNAATFGAPSTQGFLNFLNIQKTGN